MKTWALAVAAAVASGQEFQCAVPNAFPQTSTVQRGFWDFLATLRFSAQSFVQTQGFCRFGTSWNRQPRLETNMGEAHSAQNNAYGGNLWFCLEEPRTQLGCVAECEARYMCAAADRPPNPGPEECCLFYRNNTGDNQPDRECFVRKRLDVEELPAGSFVNTEVKVTPIPFAMTLYFWVLQGATEFRYRNLGYLGTFWVLLLVLFLIGLCLYVRKVKYGGWDCRAWDCCRPGGWCGCCSGLVDRIYSWREVMLYGEPEYQQQDASCCTGRGKTPKSDTKTMWKDEQESLLLVRGPMP
ncbi:unnamed protein product [Effrenium voratum]|nr:unnamed protein product [Effrenium voratum]